MDLAMPWDRLGDFRPGILIPIVFSTVPNEHAAQSFDLVNQISTLHETWSSATRRTAGISPLVKS
jgi:hypothetical protein